MKLETTERSTRFSVIGPRRLYILLLMFLSLTWGSTANAQVPSPVLFFTDLDSGPNTGGESVSGFSGAYVTLYGNFFGTTQGSSSVTWNGLNCLRVVGPTGSYAGWGQRYFWYQKIVVQIGASCAAASGNVVVTVNGQASNPIPFTVRSGNIYFIATTGNDVTGNGSFASPWRTPRQCVHSVTTGAICYAQNGANQTTVDDFGAALLMNGLAGASGRPNALVAYPGATVQIGAVGSGIDFGIRVASITGVGSYWTFAGLKVIGDGLGGMAINPRSSVNWRVVANNLQCPAVTGQAACLLFELNSDFSKVYGNEVTNVGQPVTGSGGATKQTHATYWTTDANHADIGWNSIHDNRSCRGIQIHSSPQGPGTGFSQYDISIHDNVIHDDPCDAIDLATVNPSRGKVEIYNNLIYHTGIGPDPFGGESGDYSCIYIAYETNAGTDSGTIEIYNNTLSDCGAKAGSWPNNGAFNIYGGPPNLRINLRNNIIYQLPNEPYMTGEAAGWQSFVQGSNNIWFGSLAPVPTQTTGNITADPLFVNLAGKDLNLRPGSPAIDAGLTITSANSYGGYQVWNGNPIGLDGVSRPQGSAFDIGAYEFFTGSIVQRPNPPTNLTVTVQ